MFPRGLVSSEYESDDSSNEEWLSLDSSDEQNSS